jgi:hypothetical protein
MKNITSNAQYTRIYVETQMGENHIMFFLYVKRIHSLEAPTSQFSSCNWKEATTPYSQAST